MGTERLVQTDATSHNIVNPTMLGTAGASYVVHANIRKNCQHCQWSSIKRSDAFWSNNPRKRLQCACVDVFTRPTLLWFEFHANGRNTVALHFVSHRTIEILGLIAPMLRPMQTDATLLANNTQHC